jgi:antitoxin component HigA of HigAB toxin-antitoxin module
MMLHTQQIAQTWQNFYNTLHPIENEVEYHAMTTFMRDLMQQYDISSQPYKSLWDLAAKYVQQWEQANDPWLQQPATGRDALAFLLRDRGVSQYQLYKAGVAHQSTLSSILSGKRSISLGVAKKLATFFAVPLELFL